MDALLIFIKNPERGKVKTRLARTVGDDRALAVYRALLEHTRRVALAAPAGRLLFYSGFIPPRDEWDPDRFRKFIQQGDDLGSRMLHAFRLALDEERYDRAVIIGSDCPALTPAILRAAFVQLDRHDFVIGPARDGGYYLLGMRRPAPSLFTGISWSTPTVLAVTLDRIRALGKSWYELPTLPDIDTEEDWNRYGWEI